MNGSYDRCDRCKRFVHRRPWLVTVCSGWAGSDYVHVFRLCEECAAELRKFMRVDERKCTK